MGDVKKQDLQKIVKSITSSFDGDRVKASFSIALSDSNLCTFFSDKDGAKIVYKNVILDFNRRDCLKQITHTKLNADGVLIKSSTIDVSFMGNEYALAPFINRSSLGEKEPKEVNDAIVYIYNHKNLFRVEERPIAAVAGDRSAGRGGAGAGSGSIFVAPTATAAPARAAKIDKMTEVKVDRIAPVAIKAAESDEVVAVPPVPSIASKEVVNIGAGKSAFVPHK